VRATDKDAASNGRIVYSIQQLPDGLCYRIDPTSGMIYLNCQLDRETKTRYDFLVIARDQAKEGAR